MYTVPKSASQNFSTISFSVSRRAQAPHGSRREVDGCSCESTKRNNLSKKADQEEVIYHITTITLVPSYSALFYFTVCKTEQHCVKRIYTGVVGCEKDKTYGRIYPHVHTNTSY